MYREPPSPNTGRALAAVLVVVAVSLAACSPTPTLVPSPSSEPQPVVIVDPDIRPMMDPHVVAEIVRTQIHGMEQIVGRTVVPVRVIRLTATTSDRVARIEPTSGKGIRAAGIVWVVRAVGTFTTQRGRGVQKPTAESGFFVIDDQNGTILDFGFP